MRRACRFPDCFEGSLCQGQRIAFRELMVQRERHEFALTNHEADFIRGDHAGPARKSTKPAGLILTGAPQGTKSLNKVKADSAEKIGNIRNDAV